MKYNFDEVICRKNTNCVKYDALKKLFGYDGLTPLWIADMDFKTPDFIIAAIRKRLEHEVLGYGCRPDSFYQSAQGWIERRHNWNTKTEWMSFTPGVVPGLSISVQAFTQPGDKVLITPPVYPPFFEVVRRNHRTLVESHLILENDRYSFNFAELEKLLPEVKMMILCNPHNPVGRVWTKEELTRVGELCIKHNVLLISDEIHADLVFKPYQHTCTASISPEIANNTITFTAPSKTFNMAGLSTGLVICPNPTLLRQFNYAIETLNVEVGNILGTVAFEAAYNQGDEWLDQLLAYVEKNMDYVIDYIGKNIPEIKVHKPEGTYLLWLDFSSLNLTHDELDELLIGKAKLAMNDGEAFCKQTKTCRRLNTACPRTLLENALEHLNKAING